MGFFDSLGSLWGLNGEEIYRNFRGRTGDDGEALYAAATIGQRIRKRYDDRMTSITNLTTKMESAWQGDGGGAAQRGAGPLAVEHGLAVPEIATASSSMQNQFEAFTSAKGAVVEVPPQPKEPSGWDNLFSFGQAGRDYDTKNTQYNAANEHNQTVMESYESATSTNSSSMPTSYGRITDDHSAVGVLPPTPPPPRKPWPPPENTNNNDDGSDNNNNNFNNNNLNNNNQNNTQDPNQNQNQNQTDPNNPNQTDPSQNRPTDPSQVRPPGTGEPPPGRVPGPGGGGQNQGPGGAGYPGFMPPGGGFGPTGDDSRSGGRGGYGGRGGGGFGPGGSGGGSGAGGAGGRGGGLGGGMPGAAAAAEGAAARGGVGGRGGMGMGGAPMGAGGNRGQGEDDAEHDRPSFLVEPDPHDTFGTDEVTAPPVIGE